MDIQEKIEAYFAGKLSRNEQLELEGELESNPEVKKEFELQSDISQALEEIRVAELKAQLSSVPVSTGLFDQTIAKVITSVVVITGVSIIGYMLYTNENDVIPQDNQVEVLSEPTEEIVPEKKAIDQKTQGKQAEQSAEKETSSASKSATPKPVTPNVIEEFSDKDTQDEIVVPENDVLESSPTTNTGIGIELREGTEYDFHYKFQNDRLFLYGNFSDELYDILEIKSDTSSNLFFAYKGKFYQLDRKQNAISPLVELDDQALIEKLKSIKNQR